MKLFTLIIAILFFQNNINGQVFELGQSVPKNLTSTIDSIINEGFTLYRLERASWISTDYILNQNKILKTKGYLSYISNDSIKTIYWDEQQSPRILFTFSFNKTLNINNAIIAQENRIPNDKENLLIKIREDALRRINQDYTGFYKVPPKTSLNLIPFISSNLNKVIVITGNTESGIVPIGNDYVIYYNQDGEFINQTQIHKSYIPTQTSDKFQGNTLTQSMHTHVVSEFISSTDICNVLLHKEEIKWKELIIFGKNYVSIWNIASSSLKIMTNNEFRETIR